MEKIEKINEYIELAKSEIYDVIEHEVEIGDISMESAEFLHHCLENIKHLEEMKTELLQSSYMPSAPGDKKPDIKSAFGGV